MVFIMTMTSLERFMQYVDTSAGPDGCWPWTGYTRKNGCGSFGYGKSAMLAHRASALLHGLPIQSWHCAVRSCGKVNCVNPRHIVLMMPREVATYVSNIPPEPGLEAVWVLNEKSHKIKKWVTPQKARNIRRKQRTGTYCKICDAFIRSKACGNAYCSQKCRSEAHISRQPLRFCKTCKQQIPYEKNKSYRMLYCSDACRRVALQAHFKRVNPFQNGTWKDK